MFSFCDSAETVRLLSIKTGDDDTDKLQGNGGVYET